MFPSSQRARVRLRSVLKRFTYANVTATLALFVALSGGAYAAVKLPANSVGTTQIKDNAVTSPKVLDGSLLATDFKAGQLPAGPPGPAGPAGGVSGLEVVYAASIGGPFTVKSSEAHCPSGKKVTGGGHLIVGDKTNARLTVSTPGQVPNPTSWYVQALEPTPTGESWTLYAYAVCANVAPAD
jgi:hypothetical protein